MPCYVCCYFEPCISSFLALSLSADPRISANLMVHTLSAITQADIWVLRGKGFNFVKRHCPGALQKAYTSSGPIPRVRCPAGPGKAFNLPPHERISKLLYPGSITSNDEPTELRHPPLACPSNCRDVSSYSMNHILWPKHSAPRLLNFSGSEMKLRLFFMSPCPMIMNPKCNTPPFELSFYPHFEFRSRIKYTHIDYVVFTGIECLVAGAAARLPWLLQQGEAIFIANTRKCNCIAFMILIAKNGQSEFSTMCYVSKRLCCC